MPTRIFVYGTLKRGYTNYMRYLGVAENHGGATFIDHAATKSRFPLVVRPSHMLPATRGPVLMDREGEGHVIRGELYDMDDRTLAAMDILEGVKDGYYYKRKIVCRCEHDGAETEAEAYFYPANEELLKLDPIPDYDDAAHAVYQPSAHIREDILSLCNPATTTGTA